MTPGTHGAHGAQQHASDAPASAWTDGWDAGPADPHAAQQADYPWTTGFAEPAGGAVALSAQGSAALAADGPPHGAAGIVAGPVLPWRRLAAATGISAVVLLFGGLLLHAYLAPDPLGADGAVPLIRADPTPWRIRPAEEGGMVVPNQDRLVLQDLGRSTPPAEVRGFLPQPERPLPRPSLATLTSGGGVAAAITAVAGTARGAEMEVLLAREVDRQQGSIPAGAEHAAATAPDAAIAPPAALVPGIAEPPTGAGADAVPDAIADLLAGGASDLPPPMVDDIAMPPTLLASLPLGPAASAPVTAPVLPEGIAAAFGRDPLPAVVRNGGQLETPAAARIAPDPQGGFAVQLAAVSDEADVASEWDRFRRRYPELLGALDLRVRHIEGATRLGYRVQAGPLNATTAQAVCAALQAERTGCLVIGE